MNFSKDRWSAIAAHQSRDGWPDVAELRRLCLRLHQSLGYTPAASVRSVCERRGSRRLAGCLMGVRAELAQRASARERDAWYAIDRRPRWASSCGEDCGPTRSSSSHGTIGPAGTIVWRRLKLRGGPMEHNSATGLLRQMAWLTASTSARPPCRRQRRR